MAKSFIHTITRPSGVEYAYIYTPRKINGKKCNDPQYIGRVIDKDRGIFRNRARGLFTFSLESGYGDLSEKEMQEMSPMGSGREERLILNFGDAHFLYEALKKLGLYDVIYNAIPGKEDTLMSVLGFKLLASASNRYAEYWWEGSYARILFPNAKLRSQRLSEFYSHLGDEAIHRQFFSNYLRTVFKSKSRKVGVLVDSTGLPNDIQFPLTAVSTRNGETSNESRLLLVLDRKSGMPLFFRYNAGNIVDVSTLRSTLVELEAYGVDVDYAIVDAGYYSESNIRSLYNNDGGKKGRGRKSRHIPFLTRIGSNLKLYRQLVADHADDLSRAEHLIRQRDRILFVKRVRIDLFGHRAWAYIALDPARRQEAIHKYAISALDEKIPNEEIDAAMKKMGLFVLVSSEEIDTKDLMPLYYSRQAVEQVFDVSKNYAELLPLRVHNEDTFRGHLMMSFMATVAYLSINQSLKESPFNAEGAFLILNNQKCKVFDNQILPKEPNKKMNEIYKKFKISSPISISIGGNT